MRWATRVRMAFIRERLETVGTLNRSVIMKRFGVSQPQASADIKRFMEGYPGAMRYEGNPALFECPKDKRRGLHVWPERNKDGTVTCSKCGLTISKDHADEVFFDSETGRMVR